MKKTVKTIEIIIPCYNEEKNLQILVKEIDEVFKLVPNYKYKLLIIDDGSNDGTLDFIKTLSLKRNSRVNYISFSRNFGKEAAIYAGFNNCSGDLIALMDADMQHPPELIPKMISWIEKGFDCCIAYRNSRDDKPLIRNILSKLFYKLFNKLSFVNIIDNESDFGVMKKQMADAIASLSEHERFSRGIISWVGFNIKWIGYDNIKRENGKTKWSLSKLINYAETGYISFSHFPFRVILCLGTALIIFSILFALICLVKGFSLQALFVVFMLFIGGFVLAILGVMGIYMTKTYIEVKNRPIYIEKESSIKKRLARNK